jgi:hypothetical protein
MWQASVDGFPGTAEVLRALVDSQPKAAPSPQCYQPLWLEIRFHGKTSSQSDYIYRDGQSQGHNVDFPALVVANGVKKKESRNHQANRCKA